MTNTTSIKVPKKYQATIIDLYQDEDGYWAQLESGYYADGMGTYNECHTIHCDTVKEMLEQIRQIKKV